MSVRSLIPIVLPMLLLAGIDDPWPPQSATDRVWQRHAERENKWRGRQVWLHDLRKAPLTPPPPAQKPAPAR